MSSSSGVLDSLSGGLRFESHCEKLWSLHNNCEHEVNARRLVYVCLALPFAIPRWPGKNAEQLCSASEIDRFRGSLELGELAGLAGVSLRALEMGYRPKIAWLFSATMDVVVVFYISFAIVSTLLSPSLDSGHSQLNSSTTWTLPLAHFCAVSNCILQPTGSG